MSTDRGKGKKGGSGGGGTSLGVRRAQKGGGGEEKRKRSRGMAQVGLGYSTVVQDVELGRGGNNNCLCHELLPLSPPPPPSAHSNSRLKIKKSMKKRTEKGFSQCRAVKGGGKKFAEMCCTKMGGGSLELDLNILLAWSFLPSFPPSRASSCFRGERKEEDIEGGGEKGKVKSGTDGERRGGGRGGGDFFPLPCASLAYAYTKRAFI